KYSIKYEGGERIFNNDHKDMWYKTKKSAREGALFFANKKNKNVIITKGGNRARVYPNGNIELIKGEDIFDWL
ncbi:unnamed protein product, partial [marine sediment metagenome]